MAEPGKETAATPPPLPPETVLQAPAAVSEPSLEIAAGGAGAAALDSAQPKAESAHQPPPPPQETVAVVAVSKPEQTTTVAALPPPAETPAQVTAAPAAPTPPPPPTEKQESGVPKLASSSVHGEEEKPARRRWRCLRAAVCLLLLRPKSGETKPATTPPGDGKRPASGLEEEEKKPTQGEMPLPPPQKDSGSAARVPSKPEAGKGDGETEPAVLDGKRPPEPGQEQVAMATLPPPAEPETSSQETAAAAKDGKKRPLMKKFQMAGRLVQLVMSLYNKHRSKEMKPAPAMASDPGEEEDSEAKKAASSAPAPEEKQKPDSDQPEQQKKQQQHRNWPREEVRLERILEEAFTRLVAAEYNRELSGVRQKCLLTFSVFELASEVKKQSMIYWWVAEFNLRHRSDPPPAAAAKGKGAGAESRDDDADAEGVFSMLSDHGFLVPIKNWCSKVIHGCQVNPLVHWMLKRQARGDGFAELDDKGSPADLQLSSSILCLTSGNRRMLQRMRVNDESQPQAQAQAGKKDESRPRSQAGRRSKKVTTEASSSLQGKGSHVQDQQPPTTTKDDEAQVGSKSLAAAEKATSQKDEDPTQTEVKPQPAKGPKSIQPSPELEHLDEIIPQLFEGKRVILNVNAHVYPVSKSAFSNLAECLVVLQLGRWNNRDNNTYMEVDGLDSLDAIGLLKNLRYLGLRGLSRLTELPKGFKSLKKLVILDMRGCQNLVKVAASVTAQLKQLTHLDLTECYMLEHIGRGITSLTELQVFKGFVFATGTQGNKACRIQDLKRLRKLQKLTISIATDANVGKGEMAELKHLTSLQKLTITWSEIPSILEVVNKKVKYKRQELIEKWTSFQLPIDLLKLDIRCYPKKELQLEGHRKLEKLYLRGGEMERFSMKKPSPIKTLRLRYLKHFKMGWSDIRLQLNNIEYFEIVINKDKDATQEKDKDDVTKQIDEEEVKIPSFTLDRHGVWTKDEKEEHNQKFHALNKSVVKMDNEGQAPNKSVVGMDNEGQSDVIGKNKASEPSEPTPDSSTETTSAITNVNKDGDKATTKEQTAKEESVPTQELSQ